MLIVKNLTLKKNGTTILKNVSFSTKGRIFAIIGENGSGKTSLAYSIMGVDGYKVKGKILFVNKEITNMSISNRAKLGITLAWQIPADFEGLSVKDYLVASCKCTEYSKDDLKIILENNLKKIGLDKEYLNKKIKELSGGERKRVELVSVAVMKPKVAILDEPDSGIDILSFKLIKNFIREMSKKSQVVLITHSEDLARLSSYAVLLRKGVVVDTGKTERIIKIYKRFENNG